MPRLTKSQAILNALSMTLDLPVGSHVSGSGLEIRRVDENGTKFALFHNHEYLAHMEHRSGFHSWSIGKIGGEFTKAERRNFRGPAILSTPYGASYTIGE